MQKSDRIARAQRPRGGLSALALAVALAFTGLPLSAFAGAAEDAKALNVKGADLFKKGDFLAAAQAFEKAYALDSRDFRVLRYAGRAWQEIGFYERALTLLERYYGLETEAKAKETLLPSLEKLRKATPLERAAALEQSTKKYPQAHLEDEAAKALEALGDVESLRRAVPLWEVARLGARDDAVKQRIDEQLQRLRERIAGLDKAAVSAAAEAKNAPPAGGPLGDKSGVAVRADAKPSTTQWVLWGTGAAVAAGGAALWVVGAGKSSAANDDAKAGKLDFGAYEAKRDSADTLYFTGIGLAAAGVATIVSGFLLKPGPGEAPRSTLWVRPDRVELAVRF